ncbi:hypothetical protein KQI86_10705 [Clostridium sp. MSJ-11]|uniref:Uncharacterized protein n=1 Tax=Clostridium mobile TaxID=2841512 RepID=A0ABS6EIG6_9CLOT|nr:hypothetical protein [Clostridium mobile]MBU5484805.1 hypothetical protein [Clostridium mobile]
MKRKNNYIFKAALTTAAVALGTFIYKKYKENKNEDEGIVENHGVIEIEDIEDDFCCGCHNDELNETDMDSSFEIKLEDENNEDEVDEENKES